jgi:phosphate-selective porin OprO/OprP
MRMRLILRTTSVGLIAVLSMPPSAFSQTPAPAQTPAPTTVTSGWQDGFFVQSADGNNRLLFGLVAQMDGRFSLDSPRPIINTFTLRKLRPTVTGRVARYFDFKVMPDFGNGTTTVMDAYVDIRFSPKFRVRSGKDKTPVGYELLIGDAFVLFPERSIASLLVPNRDLGVQVMGDLSPKFTYGFGVYNGIPDASSSTTDVDTNSAKDLAGRIVLQPFRAATTGASSGPLAGLGFHLGASVGDQSGSVPIFRTSIGQAFFSYLTGVTADGNRTRFSPAVFYYYRSLGAYAEYMQSSQRLSRNNISTPLTHTAWNLTGSYLLTGEAASSGITRPLHPLDPEAGSWGALQIVLRYAAVNLDDDVFTFGLSGTGASGQATQFSAGMNWYPASIFKYYLSYERIDFDDRAVDPRPTEHIILFRVQLGI